MKLSGREFKIANVATVQRYGWICGETGALLRELLGLASEDGGSCAELQ